MSSADTPADSGYDHDVVIVGGGPAGCSAGVFTARDGLDTVIFDCGRSSLKRCAHLENYLGFPAGIDIETMYDLIQDHARTAGCTFVSQLVESVESVDGGFAISTQEGESVTAGRVIAATRYDGEYLRGLDDDEAMFETYELEGEQRETFDRSYADHDGTTPVEGLYIASPAEEADTQAIMAAGRGARVAHRVVAAFRRDDGWWDDCAESVDWVRREAELEAEWTDRERWREWFDSEHGEQAPVPTDSERYRRIRERYIDEALGAYLTPDERASRAERGHETVAAHLDGDVVADVLADEAMIAALDEQTVLDTVADEKIREYAESMEDQTP